MTKFTADWIYFQFIALRNIFELEYQRLDSEKDHPPEKVFLDP